MIYGLTIGSYIESVRSMVGSLFIPDREQLIK